MRSSLPLRTTKELQQWKRPLAEKFFSNTELFFLPHTAITSNEKKER